MASLVADYGESSQDESSQSDSSESDDGSAENSKECGENDAVRLPPPAFANKIKNSVFVNPYLEAENAQFAVLEKHVKMVPKKDHKKSSGVKKICYMFRKGNCRFGKKCKFTHNLTENGQPPPIETKDNESRKPQRRPRVDDASKNGSDDEGEPKEKKKRPGLTRGLIPSKRVINMYKQQKGK